MPCALTTDILIIWPNGRDQGCGKSETAAKVRILYFSLGHAERTTLLME